MNPLQSRMRRLFTEGLKAIDIAEPLISFDDDREAEVVLGFMEERKLTVIGIRHDGITAGWAKRKDLARGGTCGDHRREFQAKNLLDDGATLAHLIASLAETRYCFLKVLSRVTAIVSRSDVQKPPVRMWLFGMITILEMYITRSLEAKFPGISWESELSATRLEKARELFEERQRRNQEVRLVDCLQLGDKTQILLRDEQFREDLGFSSRRAGEKIVKDFQSLRNNLAHAQDIVTYDWDLIVKMSMRLERILSRI